MSLAERIRNITNKITGRCEFYKLGCEISNPNCRTCVKDGGMFYFDGFMSRPAGCYRELKRKEKENAD